MVTLPENVSQLSKMIPKPEKDIGCQVLIQTEGVSRHGFLRKMPDSKGGRFFDSVLNRRWGTKFVILKSGCVYIYSSESATSCVRANSLFGFQDVTQCTSEVCKSGKWVFQVSDALQDQDRDRSLYFSATSESDMKDWIDVFQKEIYQANLALFKTSPHDKLRSKPSTESSVARKNAMPRISEEIRDKMRRSMAILDTSVDIRHEDPGSSGDSDNYSDIDESEAKAKRALPPLPVPVTESAQKSKAKPGVAEKPKLPLPPTPSKPPQKIPPEAVPRKPMNAVRPLPPEPSKTPKPSNASSIIGRTVPQPPGLKPLTSGVKAFPQTSCQKPSEDYEGGSLYVGEDEYEVWVPGQDGMDHPLIKASYWTQDAEKALQMMLSINEDGVFLIRDASDSLDYKTLMVCASEAETSVRKYKIVKEASQEYSLHLGKSGFQSLQELLQYYQQNSLPNRTVKLSKPYSEVWKP